MGRADRAMASQVSGVMRGLCAVGVLHLVVDLSGAFDCDVRLLSVLSRAHTRLSDRAGTLRIVGVELPEILTALHLAALDEIFVIYQSVCAETIGRYRPGGRGTTVGRMGL
jgi:hypothetical protein